ncbi:MAG: rod shape-determining protein MreC [Gammaproteobacteria bacterium]
MNPLFSNAPSPTARMVTCIILSFLLISIDHRHQHLAQVRTTLTAVLQPLSYAVNAPIRFLTSVSENAILHRNLVVQNRNLREENLVLRARNQRLTSLQKENRRLRELLDSSTEISADVVVADVLAIEQSPIAKQIVIDKGLRENTYQGQPVVDAYGVVGQVSRVDVFSSTVLLLTDLNHAVPVQVERNALRTLARGSEEQETLYLSFVPLNADVNLGDRIVTSGLGRKFPAGYPVGEVTEVTIRPGAPFQTIKVKPMVNANRLSQVLLVTGGDNAKQENNSGNRQGTQ